MSHVVVMVAPGEGWGGLATCARARRQRSAANPVRHRITDGNPGQNDESTS